jgi:pyruvate dehydrogenase E2 component (dihydrolipoamide acetyltransferase)
MAIPVIMPKQGQSVESCILVEWKKRAGDMVAQGESLCEVETDKAVLEVPSPAAGTLLALFFQPGDEIPVLTNIAAIGAPGEDVAALRPDGGSLPVENVAAEPPASTASRETPATETAQPIAGGTITMTGTEAGVSPRARNLAQRKRIDLARVRGSGPGGRIIERDVQAALPSQPRLSPVARAMMAEGRYHAPSQGSGPGGRVMARDLAAAEAPPPISALSSPPTTQPIDEKDVDVIKIPLKGVRRVVADRMLESLQTTAQLTLHASADARAIQAYRQKLKTSDETSGLQAITLNDLLLYAVSRVLPQHPTLNALFQAEIIHQHKHVHLGFAVDTPRGLLVPVIRNANQRSLFALAQESKRLATACLSSAATPDELSGGTFTVSNLGNLGIESFTPLLNPPQVAILGVGAIQLKPVEEKGQIQFIPHLSLSLTINHQVVDGAPGARFLQALSHSLAQFELLLAY